MNKEEILARSRRDNQGKDIVDLEIQSKSRGIAGAAAMVLGAVLNIRGSFPIFYAILFSYFAAFGFSNFILGKKLGRKKNIIWLFYGIAMIGMTVCALIRAFSALKAGTV